MLPLEETQFSFHKKFFKLAGGEFRVLDSNGRLVLFSEQKAFKLREDIRVYGDEAKSREVLSIKTQQIIDFSAAYDVVDSASGEPVGSLRRKGLKSILQDEWEILDPQGQVVGQVLEDSALMAILRRFLSNLIPQRYDFVLQGRKVGSFHQQVNPFVYRATMDLSADSGRVLDRRLAVAAGILLMAIEGRQN